MQERRNSIVNVLELRLSYTNPSMWSVGSGLTSILFQEEIRSRSYLIFQMKIPLPTNSVLKNPVVSVLMYSMKQ